MQIEQDQLTLTIITITYNNAVELKKTIESIILQDYPHIEHIIVDGGSTDETLSILKQFQSNLSIAISEKDKGIYDAMNKGLKLATGDYIGFLNSGDVFLHHRVITHIASTLSKAETDGLYSDLIFCNKQDKVTRYWKAGKFNRNKMRYGWMPPHLTFYLKRSLYQKYGAYNLELGTAADYELMLRMIYKHRCTMTYYPECMVIMDNSGISGRSIKHRMKANKMDRLAWHINCINPHFLFRLLKPCRKISQYWFPQQRYRRLR